MNELKDAFYSSKSNERPDCDDISCSVNLKTIWQFMWTSETFV